MEGVAQGPGRVRAGLAPEGAGRDQGRRVPRRDLALRGRLAPARPWRQHHPPEEIAGRERRGPAPGHLARGSGEAARSEEHTSELQSLMRISYAVFCLKKKKKQMKQKQQ